MVLARLGVLVSLSLVLAGCSDEGDGLQRVTPQLSGGASLIDFGAVPVGATARSSFVVGNVGRAELVISVDPVALPFQVGVSSATIAPGREIEASLSFRPESVASFEVELRIASNDPSHSSTLVSLVGRGVEGFVTAAPTALDFSGTPVGALERGQITFFNRGEAAVEGSLEATGFGVTNAFQVDGLPELREQPAPVRLDPLEGSTLFVRYQPVEAGRDDGVLLYEVCGEGCGVEVRVSASSVEPALLIEPPFVDFGVVGIGESFTKQLEILNEGTSALRVQSIEVSGSGDLETTTAPLPAVIDPGGRFLVQLTWRPRSRVRLGADLVVKSESPDLPEAHVRIEGEAEGAFLIVQPSSLDFGAQRSEGPHRRTLALLNGGSGDLLVDELSIAGDRSFTLESPHLPIRMGGGESVLVDVLYSPIDFGTHTATITVRSGSEQWLVPVVGGRAEAVCELAFTPSVLQFGAVRVGAVRELNAQVENVGRDRCTIISAELAPPVDPAIVATSTSFPISLDARERAALSFRFAPLEERDYKNQYRVVTDDAVFPLRVLGLTGTGAVIRGCGDGIVDFGEECDDANSDPRDGCEPDCKTSGHCGNHVVEVGEECDDGNRASRDGCSAFCKLGSCGDSTRQSGEDCDDGNLQNGDGCSSACLIDKFVGDLVSAGLGGLRTIGSGTIRLAGTSGTIRRALLYWNGPTSLSDPEANAHVKLNGVPVRGTNVGFSNSNCWPFLNSQSYRADVTLIVSGDGDYLVEDLKKRAVDINGASLVVVFDDGNPSNDREITILDANDSNMVSVYEPGGWNQTLGPVTKGPSGVARLEIHASDGQSYDDGEVVVNGTPVAPSGPVFQGSTVPVESASSASSTEGSLWDIRSFDISSIVPASPVSVRITSPPTINDCVSLVVAIVDAR
ncbi:MAG: choice-of-anchor D domain-containing protein [Deltaproteobacteria bacterium]|nr:choice-of-anchor D domain-containing protein [Deltaproteobacteria bacterium]